MSNGCLTSLFTINIWLYRFFFVPLYRFRIVGNGEDRPMNVKADAQARSGNDGVILVTAFLFNIIELRLTAYLTYCRLFVLAASLRRFPQYNLITLCYERYIERVL